MTQSYNLAYVDDENDKENKKKHGNIRMDTLTHDSQNGLHEFKDVEMEKDDENKEKKEVKVQPATLAELFSFSNAFDRLLMFIGLLCAAAFGAAWPCMMILFGNMTDDFLQYGKNATNSNASIPIPTNQSYVDAFEDKMTQYALQYSYIGFGAFAASFLQVALLEHACERQIYKLRLGFFKALLRQNIGWYDEQQTGQLTSKLASDLVHIHEGIGNKMGLAVQFLSQFFTGIILGFVKGWKMTLVMMSLTPLLALCSGILGKSIVAYSTLEQVKYATAGGIAEEVLSCIRTVTSFNGQSREVERYSEALTKCKKTGIKKSAITGLSIGLTMLIMFCGYGLAFWFGSTQVNKYNETKGEEGYTPGQVLTIFFNVMIGSFALGNAAPHISSFLMAKGAGGTIFPVIKNKPVIDSSSSKGQKPSSVEGTIRFKNINFYYPTRPEDKVLKNLNLEIEPGQTVALVGASGCGKSTIVQLLQRFYDPDEGSIELDGVDIRDLNIHWLRGNIGIVSQEPILFGISIAQNIQLGNPDISMEEIIRAAKMANAHDFISSFPDRYDTLVGERGAQMSGGQKQRIAIARALVRNPKILLLDEATSALDSEGEAIVQAALDKAGEGRTTLVIAHRLSTIQNSDGICVIDQGCVVEQGKHKELMEKKKFYYNLVTLQEISSKNDETKDDVPEKENIKHQISRGVSETSRKRSISRQGSQPTASLFKTAGTKEEEEEVDEEIDRPGFRRMFKANLKEWPFIILGCFAAIITGFTFPIFSILFSEIIKTFSKTGDELLNDALLWSLMYVGLGVVNFFSHLTQQTSFGLSGERLTFRLRLAAFKNILRQDTQYFDNPKHATGVLSTRLSTDATMVKSATGVRMGIILQSIAGMVAGLTIAFVFGWKLAAALLAGIPIMSAVGALNLKIMQGKQAKNAELLEEAGKIASECIENISTVQSLTREPHFYEYYEEKLFKPYKENLKQAYLTGLASGFSQGMVFFLYAAAFRFGGWLIANDGMEADKVFRVFFAITIVGMSVGQAVSMLPDYSKAQLSAGKVFDLIDLVPAIDVYRQEGQPEPSKGEIRIKNVHFHYPTRPDVKVLKGISLEVQPGQTVALVGMSGCGKSTVISLIQRFYDIESGSILVEGLDVKDYNLKSLRSAISVVSQEPVLFDTSIRENIVYGLETEPQMSDIIEAARTANAHEFISNFPEGYETSVGEKGTQLSGGQKQRIAIARALIRNPKILLLDEATSALDTESEQIVQNALDKARAGRTCVIIAHRLSTIQNADVIYVIDNGIVVESGTHQSLLANKGAYYVLSAGQILT